MEPLNFEAIVPETNKEEDFKREELILKKLSKLTMIMYSVPQFPVVCMSVTMLVYMISMYIKYYGWTVDEVGNLLSVILTAMTVAQPIFGLIIGSSGENIEISKFKKYFICGLSMYGGTPLLYLVGYMFLIYLPKVLTAKTGWILYLVSCVIGVGWGIYEIAFAAIGSNLSTNYDVRIDLQTWATSLYTSGILVSHLMHGTLGLVLTDRNGLLNRHYILSGIFFAFMITSLVLFQIFVKIPEKNIGQWSNRKNVETTTTSDRPKLPLKDRLTLKFNELKDFLKEYYKIISNRYAIAMTLIDSSNCIFATISGYALCITAKHFLGMPKFEAFAPFITYTSMTLILPPWFKIREYFNPEKRISIFISLICETIIIVLLLYTVTYRNLAWFVTVVVLYGFSHGIFLTTVQSLNGDVVDYGHSKNNKRAEGHLFGFVYFIKNATSIIALKLCFYFLEMYGYTGKEDEVLTPRVSAAVKLNLLVVFGITYSIAYIALAIYKIDRKFHRAIISDILKFKESMESAEINNGNDNV